MSAPLVESPHMQMFVAVGEQKTGMDWTVVGRSLFTNGILMVIFECELLLFFVNGILKNVAPVFCDFA